MVLSPRVRSNSLRASGSCQSSSMFGEPRAFSLVSIFLYSAPSDVENLASVFECGVPASVGASLFTSSKPLSVRRSRWGTTVNLCCIPSRRTRGRVTGRWERSSRKVRTNITCTEVASTASVVPVAWLMLNLGGQGTLILPCGTPTEACPHMSSDPRASVNARNKRSTKSFVKYPKLVSSP